MAESRKIIGYRRVPRPFVALADVVLIDGELCDRHGKVVSRGVFEPVYEDDPDAAAVIAENKEQERLTRELDVRRQTVGS